MFDTSRLIWESGTTHGTTLSKMRTKALLLTAALSVAGVATSMAQVYSVNAVGYVKVNLVAGFNLIANPLTASDNSLARLFKGALGEGDQLFLFSNGGFSTISVDAVNRDGSLELLPAGSGATQTKPGQGLVVKALAATTVTFVGEVSQGSLSHPIAKGLSIQSSEVPQAGTVVDLGLVGQDGDQIFKFNTATQGYDTINNDGGDWLGGAPSLKVGEAIFLNSQAAGAWTRTFSVNS